MESVLSVKNLSKGYEQPILTNIGFDMRKGDIIGFTGSSGVGKTTLLRILNMLEEPDSGKIDILGHNLSQLNGQSLMLRRAVSMVFQKPVLFSTSVFDNLYYGLMIRGVPREKARKPISDILKRVGLTNKAYEKTHNLSGGEAQRIAIAQHVLLQPRILMLDEPTANLDRENVKIIEGLINELNKKHKTSIIISTHDLPHAKRLCKRIYSLEKGKLKVIK